MANFDNEKAARREYDYIFSVDWQQPGAAFNYDKGCFAHYCAILANAIERELKTQAGKDMATDIRRFIEAIQ